MQKLFFLFALLFTVVVSTVQADSLFVTETIEKTRVGPGTVSETKVTVRGHFTHSIAEVGDDIYAWERTANMFTKQDSIPFVADLRVCWYNDIILFDFNDETRLTDWGNNSDEYVKDYHRWQEVVDSMKYLENNGLTEAFKERYEELRKESGQGFMWAVLMHERVNARIRIINRVTGIVRNTTSAYEPYSENPKIWGGAVVMFADPQDDKMSIGLIFDLTKLDPEFSKIFGDVGPYPYATKKGKLKQN